MGRTKLWPVRILVPMTKEMQSRLDAVTGEGEARLDVIREGIEREIKRREKRRSKE